MNSLKTQKFMSMFNDILSNKNGASLKDLVPKADSSGDEVDLVNTQKENNMSLRLGQRNVLFLKKVEAAKQKILDGTYGLCDDCGSDISEKRLLARPTACLCIDCQEEKEREQFSNINFRRDLKNSKKLGDELDNVHTLAANKKINSISDIGFESVVDM